MFDKNIITIKNIVSVLSRYYFPADMSVVSDIDIKDEPLLPSPDDNEVGYTVHGLLAVGQFVVKKFFSFG